MPPQPQSSSPGQAAADADRVLRPVSLLRSPGALLITALAASDVAYCLLLREPLRRAIGIWH